MIFHRFSEVSKSKRACGTLEHLRTRIQSVHFKELLRRGNYLNIAVGVSGSLLGHHDSLQIPFLM
jgi:hypothetical protein